MKVKTYTLEQLAQHHENTGSVVSKYVNASDYHDLQIKHAKLLAEHLTQLLETMADHAHAEFRYSEEGICLFNALD